MEHTHTHRRQAHTHNTRTTTRNITTNSCFITLLQLRKCETSGTTVWGWGGEGEGRRGMRRGGKEGVGLGCGWFDGWLVVCDAFVVVSKITLTMKRWIWLESHHGRVSDTSHLARADCLPVPPCPRAHHRCDELTKNSFQLPSLTPHGCHHSGVAQSISSATRIRRIPVHEQTCRGHHDCTVVPNAVDLGPTRALHEALARNDGQMK